jgi:hypothetical protein
MSHRLPIAFVLFAGTALLLSTERAIPAAGGDKTTEANLKKEVSQLQTQVNQLQTTNTQAQNTNKSLQSTIDGYRGAGLLHIVLLKAKMDTSSTDTADTKSKSDPKKDAKEKEAKDPQKLIDDAYSQLAKIKGVRGLWAGKPTANSTSSDANSEYTVALVAVFDDAAGLKAYLKDSVHTKFADKYLKNYETPIVFDVEPRKPQP